MSESSILSPINRSQTRHRVASHRARRSTFVASLFARVAAILAAAAGISILPALASVSQDVLMVEAWRVVGLFTFAALFTFLAVRPLASLTLWLIVLGNKLVLAIIGITLGAEVSGALEAAAWDGVLVVMLSAGFASATFARRDQSSSVQSSGSGE